MDEEELARKAQEQGGTGTAEDLNPRKHLESLRKQETNIPRGAQDLELFGDGQTSQASGFFCFFCLKL